MNLFHLRYFVELAHPDIIPKPRNISVLPSPVSAMLSASWKRNWVFPYLKDPAEIPPLPVSGSSFWIVRKML